MIDTQKELIQLRQQEYHCRLRVSQLRREVFSQTDLSEISPVPLKELGLAERELDAAEKKRIACQTQNSNSGLILNTKRTDRSLGERTTGLEAQVYLRMEHIPTSMVHLCESQWNPLVSFKVRNKDKDKKTHRVRVISYVEGYSAKAVDTIELKHNDVVEFNQMPTFFPERLRLVTELTRATLNVLIEDLIGKIELQRTQPVWLLANTTAPLEIQDPKSGEWQDMTRYLGAFVTPNAPSLMQYLRVAAEKHPDKCLGGYQGNIDNVTLQVKAIFNALKQESKMKYVNSTIDFNPDQGSLSQRVRLPRESLSHGEANCIDGTVLFASLLEGISMNPAIVLIPGHAFVAWETWNDSNEWKYLETTMVGTHSFKQACKAAEALSSEYRELANQEGDSTLFRHISLKVLRTKYRITPME